MVSKYYTLRNGEVWDNEGHKSIVAAKAQVEDHLETDSFGDDDTTWEIVQVVMVGETSSKVTWEKAE